ncbi:4'-phosphopantetheinyl transferase domain, partial [Dillenia turbinata]
ETHLWYILPDDVKNESLLSQYVEILSPDEKETMLSMRGEQLQKRALLARVLARTTIARYQINSQVTPSSLKFRKNIHGKPELEWQACDNWTPPPLHFNLSHTSSLIACGVTMGSPQRVMKNNVLSFARRYFSQQEVDFLSAFSDPEVQRLEFLKLWTLKEAYVKALGKGFSASPFKTFTIRLSKGSTHQSAESGSESSEIVVEPFGDTKNHTCNWHFALLELACTHYAAICMEKNNNAGNGSRPMKVTVWKTIPFVQDECVCGTDAVEKIAG